MFRSFPGQPLRAGDDSDSGCDEHYLDGTGPSVGASMEPRDETGDRDIKETGGCKRERVGQRSLRLAQSKIRHYCAENRGDPGREIEQQRPRARQPGLHEDGEVTHPVRDLMRSHGESRQDAQLHTAKKGCGDECAIECVVQAVANQYQHARGTIAGLFCSVTMPVPGARLMCIVGVLRTGGRTAIIEVRVRVPPQHQFLDDEEHPESREQHQSDAMCAGRAGARHRFGQQREQRRSEQRSGREADEVRQDERAVLSTYPEENDRERRARDAANGGEQHDGEQQCHGYSSRQISAAMRPQRPSRR